MPSIIAPLSVISAAVMTVAAGIAVMPFLGHGLPSFLYQRLMGLVGLLPTRKSAWGTVYDARTKRPIPFAVVRLLDHNRRVLESRVADVDGRYGFLATPESLHAENMQIFLEPSRSGYVFPAATQPTVDSFVYGNLYYGGAVAISGTELIGHDIPMDPIGASAHGSTGISPSVALGVSVAALADIGFWVGFLAVPINFILAPNPFTFGLLCLFLGVASLRVFDITVHPFGVVVDRQTGRPIPFALITLDDSSGGRVAFAVSDERGRYVIMAPKGPSYSLKVCTPANILPQRRASAPLSTTGGWITRKITV